MHVLQLTHGRVEKQAEVKDQMSVECHLLKSIVMMGLEQGKTCSLPLTNPLKLFRHGVPMAAPGMQEPWQHVTLHNDKDQTILVTAPDTTPLR